MPRVQLVPPNRAQVSAPEAGSQWATYFAEAAPLHLRALRLAPGVEKRIGGFDRASVAFVWLGSIETRGTSLPPRSTIIFERGGAADIIAGPDGANLLIFCDGALPKDQQELGSGAAHVLPADRVPRKHSLAGEGTVGGALYADARILGLPLWLHENEFRTPGFDVGVHSHSENEIIFVQAGHIVLGRRAYGPGTALAVSANTKYGFTAGEDGLNFVNFRVGSPSYVSADGTHSMDEGTFWREAMGTPQYE